MHGKQLQQDARITRVGMIEQISGLTVMMYIVQHSSSARDTSAAILMDWRLHITRTLPFLYGSTLQLYP